MPSITVRKQVFRAIESFPIGAEFTSADVVALVRHNSATIQCVSGIIKQYPGIVNTTSRKNIAIWRRTQ